LIDLGCNKEAIANSGATPLHYAARWGTPANIKQLIDCGCNTSTEDSRGLRAFDVALQDAQKLQAFVECKIGPTLPSVSNEGSLERAYKLNFAILLLVIQAYKNDPQLIQRLQDACPICLEDLSGGKNLIEQTNWTNILEMKCCKMLCHRNCIIPWIEGESGSCPKCRGNV
jgi:hypothetical protein